MFDPGPLYLFDKLFQEREKVVVAGVDEAGRGPLAGPVVAGAVVLDLDTPLEGINDSKKLSEAKRERAYAAIISGARAWAIGIATPEEIDRINILNASLLAMKRALEQISSPFSMVIVDGNREIPQLQWAQTTIVKGDGISASIAAASVVAKVTRDRMMHELHHTYPEYGFDVHKGYPTARHRSAVTALGLTPVHRKSFCTSLVSQTSLDL